MEELIGEIASEHGLSRRQTGDIIKAFFGKAADTLSEGSHVRIAGFGMFKVQTQAPRKGRNPRTGEIIDIPSRNKVTFKAADAVNAKVND